ncbi:MAG: hypothetical protein K2G93_01060 [Rikenella sp.]|nr:hypothetical protein [Rikenella sp.]
MFRKRDRAYEAPEPGADLRGVGALTAAEEESAPPDWREPEPELEEETPEELAERANPRRRKRGIRIGQFFTGGVLSQDEFTRRLPVIVYVVFLMLLYIANGFHIQHKHSELDRISDELKQLKTEAVTSSAVRMTLTRQSEIERLLRERNIPLRQGGTLLHVIKD